MDHVRPNYTPALGRIVLHRAEHSTSIVPAVIVATAESAVGANASDVPALTNGAHVHLVRFSPAAGAIGLGGTEVVHDVPEDAHDGPFYMTSLQTPGTWRWPNTR